MSSHLPSPSSTTTPSPSPSIIKPPPRRVPPPCWTHEETLALIESYHEKWYSLRRGNLKAFHWQEVADSVARRCRFAIPSKTSVQCRHKIEKLRKRYRTEKQRALNAPNRFSSSWNFFKKMDDMEKGPLQSTTTSITITPQSQTTITAMDSDENDSDDEDLDQDDDDDVDDDDPRQSHHPHLPHHGIVNNVHYISTSATNAHRLMAAAANGGGGGGSPSPVGGSGGFRFRIPSGSRTVPSPLGSVKKPMNYARFDETPNSVKPNVIHNSNSGPNPRYFNSSSGAGGGSGGGSGGSLSRSVGYGIKSEGGVGSGSGKVASGGSKRGMDPIADMVSSIRMLGEKFVKMEEMKIGMAREMEQMRMDMELKRTEMILDSQQRIIEAFAQGITGRKKMKRMPTPEES